MTRAGVPKPTMRGAEASAFVDAFLLALRPGQVAWLRQILTRGGFVTKAELAACPALAPLLGQKTGQEPRIHARYAAQLGARLDHMAKARDVAADISDAAARGDFEEALCSLRDNGGAFISMTQGVEAAQRIAEAFPEAIAQNHMTLGLLRTVNALKVGDLARADVLMEAARERFGLPKLENCQSEADPEIVCVLFMKAVYDDASVPDVALDQLFATLRDLPADAALMRGLLYNVGLDVLMRRNQIAMADEAAQRALFHYEAAGETGLGFYIQLYLVTVALWKGDVARAAEALKAAEVALSMFSGHSANDTSLLQIFSLIQKYETGVPDPLVRHLVEQDDSVLFGELWPAMAEPILSYGRRALATYATPAAALSWVQRWRLRQWRSHRFDTLISVQEARALQTLRRNQEADEVLSRMSGGESDDLVVARIISALDRAPGSEELAAKIRKAIDEPGHSARQRLTLLLLAAESASNRRSEREAARRLSQAFAPPIDGQVACVLREERRRLSRIMANRALRTELRRLPQLNQCLQDVIDLAAPSVPEALTRQEYRVLLLLAEAQPNKMIAQRLGISLATVKFHVSNMLKKTGVRNRNALVQHGVAAGWLQGRP